MWIRAITKMHLNLFLTRSYVRRVIKTHCSGKRSVGNSWAIDPSISFVVCDARNSAIALELHS